MAVPGEPLRIVRTGSGQMVNVRVVRRAGVRPWPASVFRSRVSVISLPLYALYRLVLLTWHLLRRSAGWSVIVTPWPARQPRPADTSEPLWRIDVETREDARRCAESVAASIDRGELLT